MSPKERDPDVPGLALKIGIAGAIGLGAIVSGLVMSRPGRRLVREAWEGRRRTRLEDRVLDVLWGDPYVGHRRFDVEDMGDGVVTLSGVVRSRREHTRALRLTRRVKDVASVVDHLIVEPGPARHRTRRRLRRRSED